LEWPFGLPGASTASSGMAAEVSCRVVVALQQSGLERDMREVFLASDDTVGTLLQRLGWLEAASDGWELVDASCAGGERRIGNVSETLHSAGLWPSARLVLRRTASLKIRVCTCRPGDGFKDLLARPDDLCASLARKGLEALPAAFEGEVQSVEADRCRLVYCGVVLNNSKTLENQQVTAGSVIVLAPPVQRAPRPQPVPNRHDAPLRAIATVAPPGEVPMCRICFDTDTAPGDVLFSPCLCRGSVAHVHAACLQEWRGAAPTQRSRFRCDSCGYEYRVQRSVVGRFLCSDAGGVTCAVTAFVLLVYVAGLIGLAAVPPKRRQALYRSMRLDRQPKTMHAEVVHLGAAFVGLACFAAYALAEVARAYFLHAHLGVNWRRALEPAALLGCWVAAEAIEVQRARSFAVIGIMLCAKGLYAATLDVARRVATKLGERVLDVRAR